MMINVESVNKHTTGFGSLYKGDIFTINYPSGTSDCFIRTEYLDNRGFINAVSLKTGKGYHFFNCDTVERISCGALELSGVVRKELV